MTGGAWDAVFRELDGWGDLGRTARLWWRDDDAVSATTALSDLLALAEDRPLGLAVIPKFADASLFEALTGRDRVAVLPHGWSHANHEPPDRKRAEFGAARNHADATADLERGMALLEAAAPSRFRRVFVPPWNRVAPALADRLIASGLALSTYNDRAPGSGAARVNTHVDVLDWAAKKRDGRAAFLGEEPVLRGLAAALERRRAGNAGTDPTEPVGLLTHHLEHDAATWRFLATLLPRLDAHPAARWVDAEEGLDR